MMRGLNSWQLNGSYLVAIQYGDVEQCAALLAAGADADQTFKINSITRPALCLGVERGAYPLVELFLRSGVTVNRRDSLGYTPLHVAVEMGYDTIVDLLLANGADVNAANDRFVTPLHAAAKRGALNIASKLFDHGCDISRMDDNGKSALNYACATPITNKQLIHFLLDNGSIPDQADHYGQTPLLCILLSRNFDFETVNLFVERGCWIHITTREENTLVHIIVLSNNVDKWKCLKLLLKRGCDMNLCNKLGQSPVHLACLMQDIESLRVLIRADADVNTVDRLGISPLGYCITNGFSEFAHLLIDAGAKEDLSHFKPHLQRLKTSFHNDLQFRLKNPMSLKEIARKSLCTTLGPFIEDWVVENRTQIPATLIPFLMFIDN